jgi:hypothetical protein
MPSPDRLCQLIRATGGPSRSFGAVKHQLGAPLMDLPECSTSAHGGIAALEHDDRAQQFTHHFNLVPVDAGLSPQLQNPPVDLQGLARVEADRQRNGAVAGRAGAGGNLTGKVVGAGLGALPQLAMLASAEEALLVDHSKFGKTATYAYGTVAGYHTVITDTGTPEAELAAIRDLGVPVETVEPEEPSP